MELAFDTCRSSLASRVYGTLDMVNALFVLFPLKPPVVLGKSRFTPTKFILSASIRRLYTVYGQYFEIYFAILLFLKNFIS